MLSILESLYAHILQHVAEVEAQIPELDSEPHLNWYQGFSSGLSLVIRALPVNGLTLVPGHLSHILRRAVSLLGASVSQEDSI